MLCERGCGKEATFVTVWGKHVCSKIQQLCPPTRAKWRETMAKKKAAGWIPSWRGKYKKVTGGKLQKLSDEEIFRVHDKDSPKGVTRSDFLKRELLRRGFVLSLNKCNKCGTEEWLDRPMLIDLHHKNGNDNDCRRENLEIICPNCHRYTDTYGVNKGTKKNGQLQS
jgi:hypothetical protein